VLDKQLQHTLSLGYVPHLQTSAVRAHVRAAVAEVSHSSQWRVAFSDVYAIYTCCTTLGIAHALVQYSASLQEVVVVLTLAELPVVTTAIRCQLHI
jgi:hypothetical protein